MKKINLISIIIFIISLVYFNFIHINNNNNNNIVEKTCDHKHLVDRVDRLVLPDNIVPSKYDLHLRPNFKGFRFYRSKYVVNGEDRYIGTTQFEATDARRAFPCFDEPALKSFFNIKITISSHLTALSNMGTTSVIENSDGTKTFIFEQTPKMSTYIVAFVVGEFDFIESTTKEGIRVRVYKCVGNKESSEFALDVATKSLSYFIDYFGIPYPLTKCDHIAIPIWIWICNQIYSEDKILNERLDYNIILKKWYKSATLDYITIINRSGSQQQLDSEFFSQQPLVNEQ
ncbi:hypothetical protein ACTFIW_009656 [Dictyostelium discoideum]